MPFNLGMGEVLVILIVALLVFGGRLPQVGRSLGRGILEFKEGLAGRSDPEHEQDEEDEDETVKTDALELDTGETEATEGVAPEEELLSEPSDNGQSK